MPPRKEDRKKTEKARLVRKTKSQLNMPANLKISIPLQGTEQVGVHVPIVKGRRPPQFTKHLDFKTKVNLANSVARQQLVKEEPVFEVDNVVIIHHTPKPRGRKKNVREMSDFFENCVGMGSNAEATGTKLAEKISPGKKAAPPRKILTRKRLADSKALEDAKRSKVEAKTDTETHGAIIKLEDTTADVPVEPECVPLVEPLPPIVQPKPDLLQPTSEVVQPHPKKTKSSHKPLQPTANKPPPMRKLTPGRKRGSKGKQQNVQASIETPSIVEWLKNKVREPVVKTKQNQHNAPELVESRESCVGSSPRLLNDKIIEAVVNIKQNQKRGLGQFRKNSVVSSPNLLKNERTEAKVKTKQNQKNAPESPGSRNNSLRSSPNLLKYELTEATVKTKQNQHKAPELPESRNNSVGSRPKLLKNYLKEPKVKTKQNQQNAPELPESGKNSVGSSPNLLKDELTEAEVKTKQNQQNAPELPESRNNSVGSSPNLLKNYFKEPKGKTNQNQQNASELPESRNNSVGSRPNLLEDKLTEAIVKPKQNQQKELAESRNIFFGSSPNLLNNKPTDAKEKSLRNQQNVQRLAKSQKSPVVSSSNLLRNKVTEAVVKTKQNQQNEPGLVDSRKSSVGSSSNKSWTRDISSSSNTTCIASVSSNDFVRINKKLPVLKLTNIDSEVKKRQNEAQEIAPSFVVPMDDTDADLSDTYDSDSSDSVNKFSDQSNDSLVANSLHLSASSSSQFTQSRRDPKESNSDYGKAANKLSLTLEKLDLEIIRWMNSENENVNANLVKFRDKMFDILDREFGVITHCRHLKEMLNPPKKGGSINKSLISQKIQGDEDDIEIVEKNYPLVENTPVVEKAPAENSPVVEKAPVENSPVVEKAPVRNSPIVEKAPAENSSVVENAPVVKAPVEENTLAENHNTKLVKDLFEPRRRLSRYQSSISEGSISNASVAGKDVSSDETAAGTSYPYYDHHDDDDALSLFAESISGFESSKINTSNASVAAPKQPKVEEYIPKPIKEVYVPKSEKQTYCPTKIKDDAEMIALKIINVCEKQNADSTSIYKQSISTDDAESSQDLTDNLDLDTKLGPSDVIKKPRLMETYYESLSKSKSLVFNGLCFYNLMNCCRKVFYGQCRFLHLVPTQAQVKEKLSHLEERTLVQEYIMLRCWAELRRRYGICYVEECANRGLTRVLVEMAYDYIVKARNECEEDKQSRVKVIEVTLLHLNTVDLSICEDLLKLTITSHQVNRTLLCDVFMATMSITQNFSRFKIVFLNLTYFMVANDRTFNKIVVEHILERVCILPFDEAIARALIQMMRMTKSDIFNNSMIGHFEKQISVNKDVFEEYQLLKNQWAFSSMLASSVVAASPPLPATPVRADAPHAPDPLPPAASPDTTNLDNMNKGAEEPSKTVITRTIGMNPVIIFNRAALSSGDSRASVSPGHSKYLANPSPSKSYVNNTESDKKDDSIQLNIRKWRNRSIYPHGLPPPMAFIHGTPTRGTPPRGTSPRMRPPIWSQMRPPQRLPFNQRQVTFKSPSNYVHRQPGPQY